MEWPSLEVKTAGWAGSSSVQQRIRSSVLNMCLRCQLSAFLSFFFPFIFISWRLITLQYCGGFCHTLTWISHGFTCVPHPDAPSSTWSLWVFPVHQARALVSCIQPGLVICFTVDNIHVSMLFSRNIPPSPSPTESKSLFCTSLSLFLFCFSNYLLEATWLGFVSISLTDWYFCEIQYKYIPRKWNKDI